jgi:sortase (surface protein transpeptidase)
VAAGRFPSQLHDPWGSDPPEAFDQTMVWRVNPADVTPAAARRSDRIRRFRNGSLIALLATVLVTISALAGIALNQRPQPLPAHAPVHRSNTATQRAFPTAPSVPPATANGVTVATTGGTAANPVVTTPALRTSRLVIPVLGVDAPVEVKSLDANNAMQTPDQPFDVVWYDFSGQPGAIGNAVFAGHLDYHDVGPAVFWDLGTLSEGDVIQVRMEDGTQYEYRVTAIATFDEATAPVHDIVSPTTTPSITLITCAGSFDEGTRLYDQRLVVRAEEIPAVTP